jgi:hypothetical protein
MEFKVRNCIILNKVMSPAGYKHSSNFYLILKEEQGIVFDQIVAPSTYTQHEIGDKIRFDLRNFDIKQTHKENIIFFLGQLIVDVLAGCLCIASIGRILNKQKSL